ncbi:hypothetical protein MPDQ_001493 [Monascus purpureus]|uniref:Uncharacterized protein n=1 Tax=Monascus purpureus TaxID=5098 RepID=A0A507R368_MONPU|nr:hypothetical protein MPDQ_001493 [Monascus purpureus]BDD61729.1 hypothetical protein MAP00_006757 [Monascus purpureus]
MEYTKDQLIDSLQKHKVNTITELRRIERILAQSASHDVTGPMTSAWLHYVNSNNLISELRGLTRSYPFSSQCLDEAKWMVIGDPASSRSWNYCWLVLMKIKNMNLIPKHARALASNPDMWGGSIPSADNINKLADSCTKEWTRAVNQMLRHWESPPTVTGR